ncbi:hypothetical protein [Sodalinema gerasimenkoae]|uniref:hypothetical protein n=1 Tax=Sodalinema gerasimenkoae TaxID=2862348 RepID=UPI0013568F27|nr:hypothetical protein [Sodalinema gerasimenkoae]
MADWLTQEQNYQQTSGLDFEFGRSGYFQVSPQNDPSESINLAYIWWIPFPSHNSTIYWWDGYELAGGQSISDEQLNSLRFIRFSPSANSNESYYLLLPDVEVDPFIDFNNIFLESQLTDPTLDDSIFSEMVTGDYQVTQVIEAELDLEDLVNFGLPESPPSQPEVPVTVPNHEGQNSASVPEMTSPLSLLVLGALFLGCLLRRQLVQRRVIAPNDH